MSLTWPSNDREWARSHHEIAERHTPDAPMRRKIFPPDNPIYCNLDAERNCEHRLIRCGDCPMIAPAILESRTEYSAEEVNPKTLVGARKVDISLLPAAGIIHGAHAMVDGAAKYGPYNWREKKVPARTYIAASIRHLLDYLDGEENAPDSGVHHLGHVIGCCAIVLDAMETGNLIDDRPIKGSAAAILARLEKVMAARQSK